MPPFFCFGHIRRRARDDSCVVLWLGVERRIDPVKRGAALDATLLTFLSIVVGTAFDFLSAKLSGAATMT